MLKKFRRIVNFEKEIQPLLQSSQKLFSTTYELKLVRYLIVTKDGGNVLLDFQGENINENINLSTLIGGDGTPNNFNKSDHYKNLIQAMKPKILIKFIKTAQEMLSCNHMSSLQLFGCHVQIIQEEKITLIGVMYNPTMSKRAEHMLKFWMKHLFNQLESEFTPKLFKYDVPSYEQNDIRRFLYYKELFELYTQMQINEMSLKFGQYVRKLLQDVLASSKARYLLSRLIIIECNDNDDVIFDHSFVKDSARNIDYMKSKPFRDLLNQFDNIRRKQNQKSILSNLRRRSVMSNYNNRTYNKDTIQELSFGPFILKISSIKTPLESEYKIALVFEKNLKRKQKLDKKTFTRLSRKLNRRYEEQKGRNDKYFQAVEFFRFLFDFKHSNPFTQFVDYNQLTDVKASARLMMLQATTPVMKQKKGSIRRRKFGSEVNNLVKSSTNDSTKLHGSFAIAIDPSKEEQIGFGGTRTSHQVQSSFSGVNLRQLNEEKSDDDSGTVEGQDAPNLEQKSPGSPQTSSSSSSDESDQDQSNEIEQNPSLNMINDFLSHQQSFQTVGLNRTIGIQNISKDFQNLQVQKSIFFGVSMRGLLSNQDDNSQSDESSGRISFDRPVDEELKFQQDMNEYKHSLYDMANDTIITISSIQEFDKEKDWLAKQVCYTSDESEGNKTIKDLATNIQVGLPSPTNQLLKTGTITQKPKRASFRIHDNSQALLHQSKNSKRPSIRITVIPDTNLSNLVPPRRQSMRVSTGKPGALMGINTQLMFEISPSTTSKRPSFRLMESQYDNRSNESPGPLQRYIGIQEKVKEEEESSGDEEEPVSSKMRQNSQIYQQNDNDSNQLPVIEEFNADNLQETSKN
eukprot:403358276